MATIEERIVLHHKFRIFDELNSNWKRFSYWGKANDIEFDDGLNGEDKIKTLIKKEQLIFRLEGNDLYIIKTY